MHSDKFTIEWIDFQSNFSNEVTQLFNDEDFVDVTLATADNKQLKAHKVILSSSSPFFKKIFKNNAHKDTLIYLRGINYNELETVLRFIYLGQAELEEANLSSFLEVAKDLEIKGFPGNLKEETQAQRNEPTVQEKSNMIIKCQQELDISMENESNESPQLIGQDLELNLVLQNLTNVGSYGCDECEYVSNHKGNLNKHKLSKHNGVKVECDQCEKSFFDHSTMNRHKKNNHN